MVQGKVIKTDPKVINQSTLGVYAIMSVDIPVRDVVTVSSAPSTKVSTELFTYTVNSGWTLKSEKSFQGYIGGVIKHYKRLLTLKDMSLDEFETCFEKYLIEFKAIETEKAYNQAQIILTDGRFIMFGLLEVANTALLFVNVEYFGIPKMVSIIGYMILTCALEYIVLYILLSAR